MKKFIQMTGIGILTMGLGLSPAFAMTEVEAQAAVQVQAKASKWDEKSRSEAVSVLSRLIREGVPVDKAYEVVNACIAQDIRGAYLAQIATDIDARLDKGASAEIAVKEAMIRIEQHAAHDGRNQMHGTGRTQVRDQGGIIGGDFGTSGGTSGGMSGGMDGSMGAGGGHGSGSGTVEMGGAAGMGR